MTKAQKIAILNDIGNGEIVSPSLRRELIDWAIQSLNEPKEKKWVPIDGKHREPTKEGEYLLTFDDGFVASVSYIDGDWELWAECGEPMAWMPLPKGYKISKRRMRKAIEKHLGRLEED